MNDYRKGFSLIELMVIVSIIAFITSIFVGYVRQSTSRGRDLRRKQNVDQIVKSINFYFNDRGSLPRNQTGWCTYISNTGGVAPGYKVLFAQDISPYMPVLQYDPTNESSVGDYLYNNTDNNNGHYTVCAIMEVPTGKSYDYSACIGGTIYNYCISQ